MPGKIFDLEEPNPNKALETLRQTALQLRDVGDSLLLDALDSAGMNADQDEAVAQLILDALDASVREASQDEAIETLILDSLSEPTV